MHGKIPSISWQAHARSCSFVCFPRLASPCFFILYLEVAYIYRSWQKAYCRAENTLLCSPTSILEAFGVCRGHTSQSWMLTGATMMCCCIACSNLAVYCFEFVCIFENTMPSWLPLLVEQAKLWLCTLCCCWLCAESIASTLVVRVQKAIDRNSESCWPTNAGKTWLCLLDWSVHQARYIVLSISDSIQQCCMFELLC